MNTSEIVTAIISIIALLIAWSQLSNLNKTLNASNLMAIFNIEFELNRRKERLSEIRKKNEEYFQTFSDKKLTQQEKDYVKILDGDRKEATENYLNVFDRLCYFVLNKKLDEADFKLDYRDMLFRTIQEDKENTFNSSTRFRNMIKLYDKWKDN